MKKTILLILAVLPIVLVIIIAFAGRILSLYQHISVERVEFVDENGDPFGEEDNFIVNMGETKSVDIRIYPELASNKRVSYTSGDESICTVDQNGNVTGVHYGATYIIVKTDDGGKTAKVDVVVTADIPVGVTIVTKGDNNTPQIPMDTLELIQGAAYDLDYIVDLPPAKDKTVKFTSSNPGVVEVDVTGRLTAVAPGTATITVTTVSGEHTDSCEVTVVKGQLPIDFDFEAIMTYEEAEALNGVYVLRYSDINIANYILLRDDINPDDVKLAITSGSVASLEDGVIEFFGSGVIVVRAYVGDRGNPTYFREITIAYR